MSNFEGSKAADVDKLSGRFLKDGTNILVKLISAFYKLSVMESVEEFSKMLANLRKEGVFLKRGRKLILPTTGQFHYFCQFRRSLKV